MCRFPQGLHHRTPLVPALPGPGVEVPLQRTHAGPEPAGQLHDRPPRPALHPLRQQEVLAEPGRRYAHVLPRSATFGRPPAHQALVNSFLPPQLEMGLSAPRRSEVDDWFLLLESDRPRPPPAPAGTEEPRGEAAAAAALFCLGLLASRCLPPH